MTWSPVGRNPDDLATEIRRDYRRAFRFAPPSLHYGYCNAAFNLAALVVEECTDKPFADALRSLLFDPLGMPITTHDPAVAMTYPSAQHHEIGPTGHLQVIHRPLVGSKWTPGSQCYSTLREMTRFAEWLLADLRTEPHPALRIDQPTTDLRLDVGTRYGPGCYLSHNAHGDTTIGHEGFFEGMWIKLLLDPTRNRGVVWLDNRGDELRDTRYELIDHLMPGLLPTAPVAPDRSGHEPDPAPLVGTCQRLGGPGLTIAADHREVNLTHDGYTARLDYFDRGIWRTPAMAGHPETWRPHAGSHHVCLGAPIIDTDDAHIVHLNAIPYRRRET